MAQGSKREESEQGPVAAARSLDSTHRLPEMLVLGPRDARATEASLAGYFENRYLGLFGAKSASVKLLFSFRLV